MSIGVMQAFGNQWPAKQARYAPLTAVIGRWRNVLLPVWAMLSAGLQTNGAFVVARCRRAPLRFGGGWQKNL